jgi:hypothetical protein
MEVLCGLLELVLMAVFSIIWVAVLVSALWSVPWKQNIGAEKAHLSG